jgi:hypothetical protein
MLTVLSPSRKRGSTSAQNEMDSRFRRNDGGVEFPRRAKDTLGRGALS